MNTLEGQDMSKVQSYIFLLLGVFFLATSAVFVNLAQAPSVIIAFYRLFFASIALLPFVLANKKMLKELTSLSRKHVFLGLLSGAFLASHYVLWFESMNYTSVASATVIVTLQPIFSVVGCYFIFNERLSKGALMGILIAIGGSIFIGWGDFQSSGNALYGDGLALLSAAIITGYFLVGQEMRKTISVVSYSLIGYMSSSVMLLAYGLLAGASFTNYPRNTWIMFLCLALVSTILGQMMINWVIKWMTTSVVSVGILSETIWASLLSYHFLGEVIYVHQGLGIVVILIGMVIFSKNYRSAT